MKIIFLSSILISASYICRAQYVSVDTPKYKIVRQDTINISGIIYDASDKPVQQIMIISKNKELKYSGYPLYTVSDKDGKFELKGALLKDTLEIGTFKGINIINNGSRYLEIHLPPDSQLNNKIKNIAEVTAHRITKVKPPASFKVITNAQINDYFGIAITKEADFVNGTGKFITIVKNRVIYPAKAIQNNIEGDVEIGFAIERDGSLTDFRVIRGIGYGCEDAVTDALKSSPKWRPAILFGRPVISRSAITINFKLTDN